MFQLPLKIFNTLRVILAKPLNKSKKIDALRRYLSWQIGSRLVPGDVLVPFVDETYLRTSFGIPGATLNVYCGLHEFEDMAFTLHLLRKGDLFVDVGANIGSYSVLAGGAVGANCLSVEPILRTFHMLEENIHLNRLSGHVHALNIGIGKEAGRLKMTAGLDAMNHVLSDSEKDVGAIEVSVVPLDDLLEGHEPILIKIDVEGFESNVIAGAGTVFSRPSLLAVIIELDGSGQRYGFDEGLIHQKMLSLGFKTYGYSPFDRQLISLEEKKNRPGNTIYVRDVDKVLSRLGKAKQYWIANAARNV